MKKTKKKMSMQEILTYSAAIAMGLAPSLANSKDGIAGTNQVVKEPRRPLTA